MFDMRFRFYCFQNLAAGIGFSACRDRCVGVAVCCVAVCGLERTRSACVGARVCGLCGLCGLCVGCSVCSHFKLFSHF